MKLLNTTTYHLKEFFDDAIPPYAILSHCWETEEVLFQDLDPSHGITARGLAKKGWSKIAGCCQQGLRDGFDYVWIDSCCIDKSSSADLSEAINSMFKWYQKAETCYAYLSDVSNVSPGDASPSFARDFVQCKWFTRGWTLQELLAPRVLVFYDCRWEVLGDRSELADLVVKASGIENVESFEEASIAQKFSWAAKRNTTRLEDRAYSLMGLFGINMPPLYGEGENAFLRLQLEIIKISDDESIFAWTDDRKRSSGLLARSPDAFLRSGRIVPMEDDELDRSSFVMTNKGLRFDSYPLEVQAHVSPFDEERYTFALKCYHAGSTRKIVIHLRRIQGELFTRVDLARLMEPFPNALQKSNITPRSNSRRSVFHVVQFGPGMTIRGPYNFTTKISPRFREQFDFSTGVNDASVSRPIRSQWHTSASAEAVLETCELPFTGTQAVLRFRGKRVVNMVRNKYKHVATFVLAVMIRQHKVACGVFFLSDSGFDYSNSYTNMAMATATYQYGPSASRLKLASGKVVKVGLRSLDDVGLQYEIDVDVEPLIVNDSQSTIASSARMK